MSQAPSMPMYWDAYLADTTHLEIHEHGAYLLLLAAMWRRNGSIPDDDKDNARILGISKAKWMKIKDRLKPFLEYENGEITQKKLQKTWSKTQEKITRNRENGAKGGRPKINKTNNLTKPDGLISDNPNESKPEPEPEPLSVGPDESDLFSANNETEKPKRKVITKHSFPEWIKPDHAQGILDQRRGKKAPVTEFWLKQFIKKMEVVRERKGDPNAAIALIIDKNWQGFEADWFFNNGISNQGQPQNKTSSIRDQIRREREQGVKNGR